LTYRGGLINKKGAGLLKKFGEGGLLERGLNRAFTVIKKLSASGNSKGATVKGQATS